MSAPGCVLRQPCNLPIMSAPHTAPFGFSDAFPSIPCA